MDYREFVDMVDSPCCVLSVEKAGEDAWGDIRIVCANAAYRKAMGPGYCDGMLYWELVPQNEKFESDAYQAAVKGRKIHVYVETKALDCWTDQTLVPLAGDDDKRGYCQFILAFTRHGEPSRMASISVGIAEEVIKACISLMGSNDLRASMEWVLNDILLVSEAETSRVMLLDDDRKTVSLFSECNKEGTKWPSFQGDEDRITYDVMKSWEDIIGASNELLIMGGRDMDELARLNPTWANGLREVGVKTLMLSPLRKYDKIFGYLYVANFNVAKHIEVKDFVELISFFLGSRIANHQLMTRLDRISHIDALTGLCNRRAMINRLRALDLAKERKPYGVVNLDLNGLKAVNDKDGHDAGDRLLIQAGKMLKKIFCEEDLFRTGGDEFIVVMSDVSRQAFLAKVESLRLDMCKQDTVSFAIGEFWNDGSMDMTDAFKHADAIMYEDKKEYYLRHPEIKRI